MTVLPPKAYVQSPLLFLAAGMAGGITLASAVSQHPKLALWVCVIGSAVLTLACITLLQVKRLLPATACLIATFVATGTALSLSQPGDRANRVSKMYDAGRIAADSPVEIVGVVLGEPESAPNGFYLTVRVERLGFRSREWDASGTVFLLARTPNERVKQEYQALDLRHGARIRVMTKLDREDDFRNPGVSAFTEYLERKGYDATGTIKSPLLVERLDDARVFLPLAWIYSWRARLQKEFSERFSAETAGVLNAALLGNAYHISAGTAERFRAGGTFHILVISGLQIAFIAGLALLLVRRVTESKLLQFALAATFIWAYTLAVGAEAAVARAALMFTVAAFAPVIARRSNSLNSVAAAALWLLVWNPTNLFDPSFQLTFLSVMAILCIALPLQERMRWIGSWRPTMATPYPPASSSWFRKLSEALYWSDRNWRSEMAASNISYRIFKTPVAATLERWRIQKLLRYSWSAVVISASVQLALLPLMVWYFHRVSFASLLLNIFVGGLMAVLGVTALLAILVAQVSTFLATPLIVLAEKTNWLMVHSVDPIASLELAALRVPHYTGWSAGIYGLFFLLLMALTVALARWDPMRRPRKASDRFAGHQVGRGAAVIFAIVLLLVVLHPFSAARPDGRLHVDFLDVGQGDCALLTTPEGTTILIDGGGQPSLSWARATGAESESTFERDTRSIGERVVSEYLWSRGLDRVDYLVATHADADHIDGLNNVARNFRLLGAIVARAPADDPDFAKFSQTLNQEGVPLQLVGAGDVIRIGSVSLEVLWPRPTAVAGAPSGNNDSIVLRVRLGEKSLLFAADVEQEAEAALVAAEMDLRSDMVKVAHHGSRTSSSEQFVAATRPAFAVISVGRHSIFGHPHKEVVERWRASGAQVMTTGEKGMISAVTDGKNLEVFTFLP